MRGFAEGRDTRAGSRGQIAVRQAGLFSLVEGDAMSKTPLLCSAALIGLMSIAMPGQAQQSAIPNFTSANFGWLVSSGFDFLPVEGKIAAVGPDRQWRRGIGLPANDFNYQPPEAAADPRRQGPSRVGPWNIE